MSEGTSRLKKVQLEAAVQMIADHVVRTAQNGGLRAESVSLELRFCLEEQHGKIVPVVHLDGVPEGQPVHTIRFELGLTSEEIERPDTSHEGVMIMDHPPPRESQQVAVTISDTAKPLVESKATPHAAPPVGGGQPTSGHQAQTPHHNKPQEVAVTLTDRSKPVIEGGVPLGDKVKPAVESSPAARSTTSAEKAEKASDQAGSVADEVKASREEREKRFAVLESVGGREEDDDEQTDEPTVADSIPTPSRDKVVVEQKGPRIVVPTHPRLKLRKASDVSRPQAATPVPAATAPELEEAKVDRKPPAQVDQAVVEVRDEPKPSVVDKRYIVFDHQRLRRRFDSGGEKAPQDGADSSGGTTASGVAGAEG